MPLIVKTGPAWQIMSSTVSSFTKFVINRVWTLDLRLPGHIWILIYLLMISTVHVRVNYSIFLLIFQLHIYKWGFNIAHILPCLCYLLFTKERFW